MTNRTIQIALLTGVAGVATSVVLDMTKSKSIKTPIGFALHAIAALGIATVAIGFSSVAFSQIADFSEKQRSELKF